jgi:hypothetical protein
MKNGRLCPSVLDCTLDETDDWFESIPDVPIVLDDCFDITGDYCHSVQVQDAIVTPVTVTPEQVIDATSAAMIPKGSEVTSPLSHLIITLYFEPFQL